VDWDERFARGDEVHEGQPSPPLPEAIRDVAPGAALDLASGVGRHALYLAERGWKVHAIDGSRVGIQRMLDEAHTRRLAIEAEVADLEAPDFRLARQYDLVLDFYFLHRPLFAQIREAVKPGGLFVAAIHLSESRFAVARGELEDLVKSWGWRVLHYREAMSRHREVAELIAQRES
jgi:SAM-dependent methyltransferase